MIQNRKSIRLQGYDYSQNGAYFVTICTKSREHLFGEIISDSCRGSISGTQGTKYCAPTWQPNDFGKIAEQCWYEISNHYQNVELDAFVVMPNHIHGIICIVGAQYFVPNSDKEHSFQKIIPGSISSVIRGYKIGVTKGCREIHPGIDVWQRNFYEHVIRDEKDLNRICEYIMNNPTNWLEDDMNQGP